MRTKDLVVRSKSGLRVEVQKTGFSARETIRKCGRQKTDNFTNGVTFATKFGLGLAKDDQTDLWGNAQANWSADRAQAAVHIDACHGRGFRREFLRCRNDRARALRVGRRKHRAAI